MTQEFPKCLYLGGDVLAVYRVVMNPHDDAKARKEGYSSVGESQAKADADAEAEALALAQDLAFVLVQPKPSTQAQPKRKHKAG